MYANVGVTWGSIPDQGITLWASLLVTSKALDFIHTHTQTSDLFTKQITLTIENIRNKKRYAKSQNIKKTAFFIVKSPFLECKNAR